MLTRAGTGRGHAPLLRADDEHPILVLLAGVADQLVFFQRQGERLLAEDVLAGLKGLDGDLHVPVVGRDDAHDVDVLAFEHLAVVAVRVGLAFADAWVVLAPVRHGARRRRRPPRCRRSGRVRGRRRCPCRPCRCSRSWVDHSLKRWRRPGATRRSKEPHRRQRRSSRTFSGTRAGMSMSVAWWASWVGCESWDWRPTASTAAPVVRILPQTGRESESRTRAVPIRGVRCRIRTWVVVAVRATESARQNAVGRDFCNDGSITTRPGSSLMSTSAV